MTTYEKGFLGERLVSSALRRTFPKAFVFDDLIIPAMNGLTQVDHVLVTTTGVFVIEVKKYSGSISGDPREPLWQQRIGRYRCAFQNPMWQNARHVSALRWQLNLAFEKMHSVVVFVGGVELAHPIAPNVMATNAAGCVGLVSYIQSFLDPLLTDHELNHTINRLHRLIKAGFTKADLLRSIRERRKTDVSSGDAVGVNQPRDVRSRLPQPEVRRQVRHAVKLSPEFWLRLALRL
jgi:restriction system protein